MTQKKRIGKPSILPWRIAMLWYQSYFKKHNVTFDRNGLKDFNGQALFMGPHLTDKDPFMVGIMLKKIRPTFVTSYHFHVDKKLRGLVKFTKSILKKQYCKDTVAIRNILRAFKEGNSIVIFPEGRGGWHSKTSPLTDGTAELAKKLSIDLFMFKIEGAYKSWPKWATYDRYGKVNVSVYRLLSADEIKKLSVDEIYKKIKESIKHDDEKTLECEKYACKDMTAGLNKILYKCPICKEEGTLTTKNNQISCSCGKLNASLDNYYKLHNAPFNTIDDWYDWQESLLDVENEVISSKVNVATVNDEEFIQFNAGSGTMTMDFDTISFKGEIFGKPLQFKENTSFIKAFPISTGAYFKMFHDNKLYFFTPMPDPNLTVKWVSWLDKIMQIKGFK